MADSSESDTKSVSLLNHSLTASFTQTLRRCYCEGHCPNGQNNGTCELKPGGMCFTSVEAVEDENGIEYPFRTYGCLPADERGLMQCKGHLVPHVEPKTIQCCEDTDLCNKDLKPMYPERPTPDSTIFLTINSPTFIALLTSITFCISLCLIIIAIVYLKYRKKLNCPHHLHHNHHHHHNNKNYIIEKYPNLLIDKTSGSGSGMPKLVQRTISKQLQMINEIGKGRYGHVWLAKWRGGQRVAVKVFLTTEEESWFHETEIYQSVLMRHDNILGFIASDIKGTGSYTQMLLITDYHENGSLYDYLQNNVLDIQNLLTMAKSISSGLSHLHTEVFSTRGKPSIAHRNIKSKNILIKRNGECCIGDFSLAIIKSINNQQDYENDSLIINNLLRCGTKRYMAPEILNNTINKINLFESFKMADMYSFGLVLWELCRRCITGNQITIVDDYKVPYYDKITNDPSFDDMLEIVCIKNIRPNISLRWESDNVLKLLTNIMQECWHSTPACRLTSLRVKKTLYKIDIDTCIKIV